MMMRPGTAALNLLITAGLNFASESVYPVLHTHPALNLAGLPRLHSRSGAAAPLSTRGVAEDQVLPVLTQSLGSLKFTIFVTSSSTAKLLHGSGKEGG